MTSTRGSPRSRPSPEITRVDPGRIDDTRDWGWLADHELLLLDDANLHEALRRLTLDGMRTALAASRELLARPISRGDRDRAG